MTDRERLVILKVLIIAAFLVFGSVMDFDESGPELARVFGHLAGLLTFGLAGGLIGSELAARWIFRTTAESCLTKPKDSEHPKTTPPEGQ